MESLTPKGADAGVRLEGEDGAAPRPLPAIVMDGSRIEAETPLGHVSVANSYSRGDREFEKATAMLCPSKVAQRGRMRDHTAAPFRRRVTV